jgi:hypothetical protein
VQRHQREKRSEGRIGENEKKWKRERRNRRKYGVGRGGGKEE